MKNTRLCAAPRNDNWTLAFFAFVFTIATIDHIGDFVSINWGVPGMNSGMNAGNGGVNKLL